MITTAKETRRQRAEREFNSAYSRLVARMMREQLRQSAARGNRIAIGRPVEMTTMNTDSNNHPNPAELRAELAQLLGVAPHASDEDVRAAFESLLEQAAPSTPREDSEIKPKVVGNRLAPVDQNMVERGKRAFSNWK
jgi:hypothetical protein